MTRATNLTTQEAVLLSRQILLLRADIVGGAQKPSPEQWAKDAEKHIGRVVTYAQMRSAAESLGFSKRDLWASGRGDSRAAAEKAAALVAGAEEMVLYYKVGESYCLADADEVALAALQLHEPMALVRMAVVAVPRRDMAWAVDELRQAIKWLQAEIEEAEA